MNDATSPENRAIEEASPALASLLSPLGGRVAYPPDIPFQAAEARGKKLNATIGQITDGMGQIVAPASLSSGLDVLAPEQRNRAMLYSPVEGIAEVREAWRHWQRSDRGESPVSTLPLVTVGLTHGLSLVADLFGGPGRPIAVPAPFWGNYRQTFAVRTGAEILSAPAYRDGRYNCEAIAEALALRPAGEPAVAILNLPSNPGGYSATVSERERICESLFPAVGDLDGDGYAEIVLALGPGLGGRLFVLGRTSRTTQMSGSPTDIASARSTAAGVSSHTPSSSSTAVRTRSINATCSTQRCDGPARLGGADDGRSRTRASRSGSAARPCISKRRACCRASRCGFLQRGSPTAAKARCRSCSRQRSWSKTRRTF